MFRREAALEANAAESSSVHGGAARSARMETDGFRRPRTFLLSLTDALVVKKNNFRVAS